MKIKKHECSECLAIRVKKANLYKYRRLARYYLNGGDMSSWVSGTKSCRVNPDTVKTELMVPERLRQAIREEAFLRGWDGCHWDDPLVIDIYYDGPSEEDVHE